MRHERTIILLTRTRLSAARVRKGRLVSAHAAVIESSAWSDAWEQQLKPYDEPLAAALQAVGAHGQSLELLYTGPDVIASVKSYPVSSHAAIDAARLALADASPFPLEKASTWIAPIAHDATGEPKRTHVLSVADSERSAESLAAWVERAGSRVQSITPCAAVTLTRLVNDLLSRSEQGVVASLRMGEHDAALAAAVDGQLRFVRTLDLGLELLIEALTRPITPRSRRDTTVTLTREEARQMLYEHGVPTPDEVVLAERGLVGADVLPALQPILQRCVVEIKQSLRFGLGDKERSAVMLRVSGVGASTPRFEQVMAAETEAATEDREAAAPVDPTTACPSGGDLDVFLEQSGPIVNLLPRRLAQAKTLKRVVRGLWAGTAAAVIAMAIEIGMDVRMIDDVSQQIDAVAEVAGQGRRVDEAMQRSRAILASVAAKESQIRSAMPLRANWRLWLNELSNLAPEGVRLGAVEGARRDGRPFVMLRGYALNEQSRESRELLKRYLDTLKASPLVEGIELGATQKAQLDGRPMQQFEIEVRLVGSPIALSDAEERP